MGEIGTSEWLSGWMHFDKKEISRGCILWFFPLIMKFLFSLGTSNDINIATAVEVSALAAKNKTDFEKKPAI